jgi:polysaccharide pyruvyl transferase WcaK-like protein
MIRTDEFPGIPCSQERLRESRGKASQLKFFVTGLCLQGNKGGPAIALSLMAALRKHIPGASFIFVVPPPPQFEFEERWAEYYGVPVVEDLWGITFWSFSPWRIIRDGLGTTYRRFKKLTKWYSALRSCQIVLDMTAISYAGPPEGTEVHALSTRPRFFRAARFARRRFLAWTQNYGPFSTARIARAAKADLATLPAVYCRGSESLRHVQELLPNKLCLLYPDVAVTLDYDKERGKPLVDQCFEESPKGPLVTISPSAVIFGKCQSVGENYHVRSLIRLCENLIEKGFTILLVPHTFNPAMHNPAECDYAVCLSILSGIRPNRRLGIVHNDLSAVDLKSIISNATLHIGARYHSVIAALSTGVPCISISWHHKYYDIMEMYGNQKFVVEGAGRTFNEDVLRLIDDVFLDYDCVVDKLKTAQRKLENSVAENARHFASLLQPTREVREL